MWRCGTVGLFLIGMCLVLPGTASADKRVALVIGNSAYVHANELANPRNDAADMAATLKGLGFEVVEGIDLDKAAMDRKVRDFATALAGADAAIFFYAGHGLQVGGVNYLVPTDAQLTTAAGLDWEMVRLDLVQRTMEREAKTNVLFLDACRDNPLARNLARAMGTRSADIGRGLAAQESGAGTLISFSTQPGNVALDGTGRNSPFSAALTKHLPTPGEDLSEILINVRNDVMQATADRQVPWEHSALRARLYLSPPADASKGRVNAAAPSPVAAAGASTRSASQVKVLDKQLVTLMGGTLRLRVTAAFAHGECTFEYDPGATGRFTETDNLKNAEWTTVKLPGGAYKLMLLTADDESCTFEFTPE